MTKRYEVMVPVWKSHGGWVYLVEADSPEEAARKAGLEQYVSYREAERHHTEDYYAWEDAEVKEVPA